MFSRPLLTSSTIDAQAGAVRMLSRRRTSGAWSGGEKEQPIGAVARLYAVVAQVVGHRFEGAPRFLTRIEVFRRQQQQAQCAVIGHAGMGCEDVHAIENGDAASQLLQNLRHFAVHFADVVEAFLAILRLTAQIGACVKPETRRILRLLPVGAFR